MSGRLSYVYKKTSLIPGLSASFVEFRLLAQAAGILMLVPRSMFNDHVVTIQPDLISRCNSGPLSTFSTN